MTREDLDKFLLWLSPDREEAGRKYEDIRRRLVKLFNCRGCENPEELADETMTRVIRIRVSGESEFSREPIVLFFGVAKNVWRESLRAKKAVPQEMPDRGHAHLEPSLNCLDACIERLPDRERGLITRYYEKEGREKIQNRQRIATELGVDMNVLRIQACRIRKTLKGCVSICLDARAKAAGVSALA